MPEPLSAAIAVRLMAPALAPASRKAFNRIAQYLKTENALPKRKTVAEIAEWIERDLSSRAAEIEDLDTEHLPAYLVSPECATLLEHLFAFRMSGRPAPIDGSLARELHAGLVVHGVTFDTASEATLFRLLHAVVDYSIGEDLEASEVLSSQSRDHATTVAVESYLQSIDAQISTLATSTPSFSAANLHDLCVRYRAALLSIDALIQPPSFDGAASVPIEDMYVAPTLDGVDSPSGAVQKYRYEDVLRTERAVVLGNPGGGKTTLGRKIANDLARGVHELERGNETPIPIIITLRGYGAFLERRAGTIVQYVAELLASRYQLSTTLDAVEWLMRTGRAYVIFDGLDELLEPTDRRRITAAISAFSTLYRSVRILVTSRRVGYLLAPLPDATFETFVLADFGEDEVATYVRNWFGLDATLTEPRREELRAKFLEDSESVDDLRANPLMLGLMCTIYRTESYIPRNRPDVYEKCARMLFDRWDRHRGLRRPLEFEAHIEPALMQLAHTIYQSDDLQSGITERTLIAEASRYLQHWQYPNAANADHAAREFVEFCKGRAWIFTDVGLAPDGEAIYQFTHRTFLEYFTGAHLARTHDNLDSLLGTLLPFILNAEWDVVVQLALQIKAKAVQGGPDRVVDALVDYVEGSR